MYESQNSLKMKRDNQCSLAVRAELENESYQSFTKEDVAWKHINFEAKALKQNQKWEGNTGENEVLFVLLSGNFAATTSAGNFQTVNGRKDVFSGFPYALYLPPNTDFSIVAISEQMDIACGSYKTETHFPARLITPQMVNDFGIELRGGDNASRQINSILPPGSPCSHLVCVEVYTPSGNWSSFPAHKHDERKVDPETGKLLEAELEEVYFYKIDKPQGFAIQQVYTPDRSLNEVAVLRNNDVMLVPRGYHPVVAGHGYNVYYLNFLAGSDQSLANTPDPDHVWIFDSWKSMDSRLPMISLEMNNK
jgi:5-deoxy-glucuronate isomerase